MSKLNEDEKSALKESGFWDLISSDVALYEIGIIDNEKFQNCVVEASKSHKNRLLKKEELEMQIKLEQEKAKTELMKRFSGQRLS